MEEERDNAQSNNGGTTSDENQETPPGDRDLAPPITEERENGTSRQDHSRHTEETGNGTSREDHSPTDQHIKMEQNTDIFHGMSGLNMIERPQKYKYGQDFNTFCDRFEQYVRLHRITHPVLYLLFLGNLDDRTYKRLKDVPLNASDKRYAALFLDKYKRNFYPSGEIVSLQMQLNNIKQKNDESIDDFSFRLTELAIRAFSNPLMKESSSFLAFMQGVREINLRVKLNESDVKSYDEAVTFAKRIERVSDAIVGNGITSDPILFQTRSHLRPVETEWGEGARRPHSTSNPHNRSGSTESTGSTSRTTSVSPSRDRCGRSSSRGRNRNDLSQIRCWP